ncbi:MAG: hypothetical protein IIZ17_04125 [Eubacteriaceae bacterium]|nr:hypothetical protein [Eubacteriaceae bacterium]
MIPRTVHWLDLWGRRYDRKRIAELEGMLPEHEFICWDTSRLAGEDLPEEILKMIDGPDPERSSSYLCAHLLYRYGGVYMDPGTVLFRDLSDMSPAGMYCFREYVPSKMEESSSLLNAYGNALGAGSVPGSGISTALMASEKGHPLLERFMQLFLDNIRKIKKEKDLAAEDLWAMAMRGWGLRYRDELQILYFGVLVYPSSYLPSDPSRLTSLSLGLSLRGDPWQRRGKLAMSLYERKSMKAAKAHAASLAETEELMPPMPAVPEETEDEPGEPEQSTPQAFFSAMDGERDEEIQALPDEDDHPDESE